MCLFDAQYNGVSHDLSEWSQLQEGPLCCYWIITVFLLLTLVLPLLSNALLSLALLLSLPSFYITDFVNGSHTHFLNSLCYCISKVLSQHPPSTPLSYCDHTKKLVVQYLSLKSTHSCNTHIYWQGKNILDKIYICT